MESRMYEARKAIALENNMKLVYINRSSYDKDWLSIPHKHTCIELIYCIRGVGQFFIENEPHTIGSDDCIIVNSNVEHTEVSFQNNPIECIIVGIEGAEFTLPEQEEKRFISLNFRHSNDTILPYLCDIMREMDECPPDYEKMCRHLMNVIFLKIGRQKHCKLSKLETTIVNKECAEIKRYIDHHYRENLNLEMLADLVHINKYYLSHSFSKAYNCSPINYMLSLRIGESKYMLTQTNNSVAKISEILGFSSPSYFTQSFKKNVGMSPIEYRNRNR